MYPRILIAVMLMGNMSYLAADQLAMPTQVSPSNLLKKNVPAAKKEEKKAAPPAPKPVVTQPVTETNAEPAATETAKLKPDANPDSPESSPAANINLPKRGLTKDSVKSKFGDPQKVIDAAGVPPIERWVYDAFTVYFEREYVIHSVAHHHQQQE